MSEVVSFPSNGGHCDGYLVPAQAGKGPGVLVFQEWWGLNDQIKGVAERLAREGFTALAPDVYHGSSAPIGEPDKAHKLMMEMEIDHTAKDARGAARFLLAHPATASHKVGVIGFCMGGMLALMSALEAPSEVGAVVDCYGWPPEGRDLSKMKAHVLGIFGGKDEMTSAQAVETLDRQFQKAGTPFEKHIYPEADHAFMNEQRTDVYRRDDAEDAWSHAMSFLRTHLV